MNCYGKLKVSQLDGYFNDFRHKGQGRRINRRFDVTVTQSSLLHFYTYGSTTT